MRPIRAILGFLATVGSLLRRAVRGIYDRFSSLLEGFLHWPLEALKAVLGAIRDQIDRAVHFLLRIWARLWKRAPSGPADKRPTPGLTGLPLTAAVVAVVLGYFLPWMDWIDVSTQRFSVAVLATFGIAFLALRQICRRIEPKRFASGLIDVHRRTGFVRVERVCLVLGLAATYLTWSEPILRPATGLLTFGFLVINMSEATFRELSDELPDLEEISVPDDPGLYEDRAFRWTAELRGESVEFAADIRVDITTLKSMKSENPRRPIDSHRPDFSPWVLDGTTPEVAQVAHAIRERSTTLGLTQLQEAIAALSFAQSFMYSLDEESTGEPEYWRYPIETIADRTGDCEDTAILGLAVCRWLGIDAVPLVTSDHAAFGFVVACGTPAAVRVDGLCLLYAETTSNVTLGVLPEGVEVSDLRKCKPRVGDRGPELVAT